MTEESGQNIKPLLEVDSEGRIWMAWERNQGDDHSIYTRVYDGNGWSPEMATLDYEEKDSFDIAADGEGKVWIGWSAWDVYGDAPTVTVGASSHWKGEWDTFPPDTIDFLQHRIDASHAGSVKTFFQGGSRRMAISSTPPIAYDPNTHTIEKLIDSDSMGWQLYPGPIRSLAQIVDGNVWVVFDMMFAVGCSGVEELLATACFLSDDAWTWFDIDRGSYLTGHLKLVTYASVKSVGGNSKNKVYVTCAVDKYPVTEITYSPAPEETHYLNTHLEMWSFDATTGDTLSHWIMGDAERSETTYRWQNDGIEVATTDESEIVGFAIGRNGNISLRALMDPVWYKLVSLEGDSIVTSQHPSTIVDNLGTIWVAWDDGKDVYLSSVRISDMEVDDVLTSVEADAEEGAVAPEKFHLASNYPNPFNAATSIGLTIPFETTGTLAIHDVLGQRVRTLLGGDLKIGEHSVLWDGRNEAGRNVASGVYLYRLTLDGKEMTETKKMVLIR